jgi:hypothetical protein
MPFPSEVKCDHEIEEEHVVKTGFSFSHKRYSKLYGDESAVKMRGWKRFRL